MGEWVAEGPGRGYLQLVGRAKDLIITGGLNVYPKEIEERIDQMDGVEESAVVGMPDPDFGEAVAAVIVGKPGHCLTEAGVIGACAARSRTSRCRSACSSQDELPRNAMGKVQKAALREKLAPRLGRTIAAACAPPPRRGAGRRRRPAQTSTRSRRRLRARRLRSSHAQHATT